MAVLVLNAGYALAGPFLELTDKEVETHMQVNANHVIYLAKAMMDQLVSRKEKQNKKSAIVIVSSIKSVIPISGAMSYCATKRFATYVGEALHQELKDAVDIICYQPGDVATKMINKTKASMSTILPEMSADVCFRDIGKRPMTRGAFRHELVAWILESMPRFIMQS